MSRRISASRVSNGPVCPPSCAPRFVLRIAPRWLAIAFSTQLALICAQTRSEYAVVLQDPPLARQTASRKTLRSATALDSTAKIRRSQGAVRQLLEARHIPVHGSAHTLVNALFIQASEDEAKALQSLPGVSRVEYQAPLSRALDRAVELVRAPAAWDVLGGETNAGAGMKIGILDTGIDQTHPGFRDDSLPVPDGFPKGRDEDLPYTNRKVIVARSYVAQLKAPDDASPQDHWGDGTASAMIAAGVRNTGPAGTIVGIAPKAYLGNYKIFGSPGVNDFTTSEALVKALEDALSDGMDVVSVSVASPTTKGPLAHDCGDNGRSPCDLRADAVENAARLGLVTVVPAGNDGFAGLRFPTLNTIQSPGTAPSAITVGASTNSHLLFAAVLAAGQKISALFGDGPKPNPPLTATVRDAGLACSSPGASTLAAAIALVQRGDCDFFTKVDNAQRAGAVGVIIYQYDGEPGIFNPEGLAGTGIPAVMIGAAGGLTLKNLARTQPDARVTLDTALSPVDTRSDLVADFSSHGPSIGDASKGEAPIKPELVAAGQDIYTATQSSDPKGDLYGATGYVAVQGTSFAVPMVAGAVALVKQRNPGFGAAQLKSAVVNTAADEINDDDGRAGVTAVGAGKLNIAAAVQVGATVEPATLSLGLIGPGTLPESLALRVTNTGADAASFTLAVTPQDTDARAQVTVSPSSLQLGSGETATVTIRLSGSQPAPGSYGGVVTIQGGSTNLRVPYLYLVGDNAGADMIPVSTNLIGIPGEKGFILAFKLIDRFGVPVRGASVRFRSVSGGGSIQLADASTDVFGIAAAIVDLGPRAGEQQFSADAGGLTIDFYGRATPR
jgi:minor extracellular serine protease Vpr